MLLTILCQIAVIILLLILVDSAFQFAVRSLLKRRSFFLETVSVFLFIFIGAWAVALVQPDHFLSGIALYIAGFLVYLEAKSIFSRGYSIRILADLLDSDQPRTVAQLKETYGGRGLKWMLDKRIQALKVFKIVHYNDGVVGPPTFLGCCIAHLGSGIRRLLKLKEVG